MEQRTNSPYPRIDRPVLALVGVVLVIGTALFIWSDRAKDWRYYQYEFRNMVAEQFGEDKAATVPSGLQQVWVAELERADRCTTCHQAINWKGFEQAEQPWRTHPPEPLKTHPVEQNQRPLLGLRTGYAVHPARGEGDVVQHRHVREQVVRLEDHADAPPNRVLVDARVGDLLAVQPDRPVVDVLQEVGAAQQRRLAGSGGADQRGHGVRGDLQIDVPQHDGAAEGLAHGLHPQHGGTLGGVHGLRGFHGLSAVAHVVPPCARCRSMRAVTQSVKRVIGMVRATKTSPATM